MEYSTSATADPATEHRNSSARPLITARHISKRYGATEALRDVSIGVGTGEAVAIVGENGAGKSTLVKILSGVVPHGTFDGELSIEGNTCTFGSVADAERHGIELIPQELQVAPSLSIVENMLAGHLPKKWGLLNERAARDTAEYWLRFFGLEGYSPTQPIGDLAPSEQRVVVIAGALSRRARILILDEPTVSLTPQETDRLFVQLRQLRAEGTAILYITHALSEVGDVADRVIVLRNGELVDELSATPSVDRRRVIRAMLGRELTEIHREHAVKGESHGRRPLMQVKSLSVFDSRVTSRVRVKRVSFTVHAGEILGLFGVIGSGAPETAMALAGAWPGRVEGSVVLGSWQGRIASPRQAIARGIVTISGDRQSQGIVQGHSVNANISASATPAFRGGLINRRVETERNAGLVDALHITTPSLDTPIDALSGGNQQKVLFARCLAANPKVLLMEDPTLGIDIGSRMEIYGILHRLADDGAGLLMITSDVAEATGQCDRVLVFRRGEIAAEREGGCPTEELVHLATSDPPGAEV